MTVPLEIPGYQIQSILGEGGMATVYLAVQESLERQVALKVMNGSLLTDKSFCDRFLVEGKTVAQLKHPAIVNIYDIGCHDSVYYMAMEYVEGGCLTDRLKESVGLMEAISIIRNMASALGYAHDHGFIHRDIKPANILFREGGEATLTDFGIAKALESDKQLTQIGFAIGTPEYMSPEQARAVKIDGRSDLYSLGIVFYELLTGRRPFSSDDAFSTALMHINQPVPPLEEHLSAYQPVIDSLLAKAPEGRYDNARQLISALDSLGAHATVEYGLDNDDRTMIAPSRLVDTDQKVAATAAQPAEMPAGPDQGAGQDSPAEVSGSPAMERKTSALVRIGLPVALVATLGLGGLSYYYMEQQSAERPSSGTASPEPAVSVPTPPAIPSPPRNDVNQARIKRLLQGAEAHMAIGRLKEPPGANAYDAYQMVLSMDPGNQQALEGIRKIESLEGEQP